MEVSPEPSDDEKELKNSDPPKQKGKGKKKHKQKQKSEKEESKNIEDELSPDEINALREFKERAGDKCNGRDDYFLMSFVLARKLDVNRALELYDKHLEWREKYEVDSIDNDGFDKIRNFLASGSTIWGPDNTDKEGRGVAYILPHLFNFEHYDPKINFQSTAWHLDISSRRVDNTRKGFVFIEDLGNMTFSIAKQMSKIDTKEIMSSMQDRLPIRMQKLYILNAPWFLKFMIALVKPFMKKKLRRRIVVVTQEQLIEEVGAENLITQLGGTLELDYTAWLDGEIQASKEANERED